MTERELLLAFIDETTEYCERMRRQYSDLWWKVDHDNPKYHEYWGRLTAYRLMRQKMKKIRRELTK